MSDGSSPPLTPSTGSRLNSTAVFSLVASISGFVCVLGFGGILGAILGLVARSEIARSEGREHGRGVANAGLALGIVNVAALFIGLAVMITLAASRPPSVPPTSVAPLSPPFLPPSPAPAPSPQTVKPETMGQATRERDNRITVIGKITLVDPGADPGRLPVLIKSELAAAETAGQKAVLWVVSPDCSPCNGVAVALSDPKLQKALEGVRLLRVDVREFAPELDRVGLPLDRIPGFALLGPDLRVLDYVDGGEWDADIPKNIAPVLGAFVRGTYTQRRHPFRAALRGGEQAL